MGRNDGLATLVGLGEDRCLVGRQDDTNGESNVGHAGTLEVCSGVSFDKGKGRRRTLPDTKSATNDIVTKFKSTMYQLQAKGNKHS